MYKSLLISLLLLVNGVAEAYEADQMTSAAIYVGTSDSPLEQYAASELRRYIYQLSGVMLPIIPDAYTGEKPISGFVLGQPDNNPVMVGGIRSETIALTKENPGPQGYVLKTSADGGAIYIGGSDDVGVLYGVYGLLDDHYDVGFYLTGDVLPQKKPFEIVDVDESVRPRQSIRGFLPWTNFPQSATSYSFEDYRFIIDQMTKMRMNFLHLHNYNGEQNHNEMFHNVEWENILSRTWFPTAGSGHAWAGPPWNVNRYLFGARELFDDYDFGSDAALHNEGLSNRDVFRKGVNLLKRVIGYAHARGVKIGLGLDINLVPTEYQTQADNPDLITARVEQISTDYPDLDYLLCFRSEGIPHTQRSDSWNNMFLKYRELLKTHAPSVRIAVSGWGLSPEAIADLPRDVIAAPISHYSAGWDDGSIYGDREYWACPWLERDFDSSVYYYPYNINLSETIKNYDRASTNTAGLLCLTWRIGDAVEPKMSYIGKAPWDLKNRFKDSHSVYFDYARRCYGDDAAASATGIINENEPYADNFSECEATPDLESKDRSKDIEKAAEQIQVVADLIERSASAEQKLRLDMLMRRLIGVREYCELDQGFMATAWEDLPHSFERWAKSFVYRVNDISSLGNIVSTQNRFVQLHYVQRERALREQLAIQPPLRVEAKGTKTGARITWQANDTTSTFNLYRDGELVAGRIRPEVLHVDDRLPGYHTYTVTAVTSEGESVHSVPVSCAAGSSDIEGPRVIVISPPVSIRAGELFRLKARLVDNRAAEELTATLYFREAGSPEDWTTVPFVRRSNGVFGAQINEFPNTDIEYYVTAGDGTSHTNWPPQAPERCMTCIVEPGEADAIMPAPTVSRDGSSLRIESGSYATPVSECRIYRSENRELECSPVTFLSYVDGSTRSFSDKSYDFEGKPLEGSYHYKVTAVSRMGRESAPSEPITIEYQARSEDAFARIPVYKAPIKNVAYKVPCLDGWYAVRLGQVASIGVPVEFSHPAKMVKVRLRAMAPSFRLQMRADDPAGGDLLLNEMIDGAKHGPGYFTLMLPIKPVSGKRLITIRALEAAHWAADLHWIQFVDQVNVFEADDAELHGASLYDEPALQSGKAIGFFGKDIGNSITFPAVKAEAVILHYALEGKPRQCGLFDGSRRIATVNFKPTAGWHDFADVQIDEPISQGPLKLQVDKKDHDANGGEFCANIGRVELDTTSTKTGRVAGKKAGKRKAR